jgi:hypothetical protein
MVNLTLGTTSLYKTAVVKRFGMAHRDIPPSNQVVRSSDLTGYAKFFNPAK